MTARQPIAVGQVWESKRKGRLGRRVTVTRGPDWSRWVIRGSVVRGETAFEQEWRIHSATLRNSYRLVSES